VLGDFAKDDQDWLDDLLRGIAEGAPALAEGDAPRFLNAVALRTAPPRSSSTAKPAPEAPPPPAPAEDDRSPLQRLIDRFR
jgi:PTH1 family peptidyl-tRNA hydrolase